MAELMNSFSGGFLCGLALFGIGEQTSEPVSLPDISKLVFVNCAYYTGDIGEGSCMLNAATYSKVFSSKFSYVPKKGGIVMMGSYHLEDFDNYGKIPRAMLKITADEKVVYEGEITGYFSSETVEEVKGFNYKSSFVIEAKRLNLSDSMSLSIYQTMIIGYK